MSRILRLAVIIPLVFLAACQEKVTDVNFKKITVGMTLNEVTNILGKGEKLEQTGTSIGGSGLTGGARENIDTAVWEWKENSKIITITVKAGKVIDMNKNF